MKEIIETYFHAFMQKDASQLSHFFSEHAVYSESDGHEYFGLEQIVRWFHDWNAQGTVLNWVITQSVEQGKLCVVEWCFACEYQQEHIEFNGVSLVEFDDTLKIVHLKEFQSQKEHIYPYGKG